MCVHLPSLVVSTAAKSLSTKQSYFKTTKPSESGNMTWVPLYPIIQDGKEPRGPAENRSTHVDPLKTSNVSLALLRVSQGVKIIFTNTHTPQRAMLITDVRSVNNNCQSHYRSREEGRNL